jgi:hypothetical protein
MNQRHSLRQTNENEKIPTNTTQENVEIESPKRTDREERKQSASSSEDVFDDDVSNNQVMRKTMVDCAVVDDRAKTTAKRMREGKDTTAKDSSATLSSLEQRLQKKVPISQDPKTFEPDSVLEIDDDFSRKAISLGYELGTIKHSAYALLAMAGPVGMTVANIVSIAKRLDLYNWGTCKTPNNSVTAALSQDAHFQRVAPSTYALKEHVPDDLCTASLPHKAAHAPKRVDSGKNATTAAAAHTSSNNNNHNNNNNNNNNIAKLQDRKYHHQKTVEAAASRGKNNNNNNTDSEDEYFDGPTFQFQTTTKKHQRANRENSEEEDEERYDERRENYHTQRIQHEEEDPPFAYKDVAERLALECYRRRADIQPELFRNQAYLMVMQKNSNEQQKENESGDDKQQQFENNPPHVVNEKNAQAIDCNATVAASCLAYFPAVSTPGIIATRQRDAICATPSEPTEAFSRASLWKTEVVLVKRLEGYEFIGRERRGGVGSSKNPSTAVGVQKIQQQQPRKVNKKSKLGGREENVVVEKKMKTKPAIKKTSSDISMKSRSASGEETCYHRLPRWVLDQYAEEQHNILTSAN